MPAEDSQKTAQGNKAEASTDQIEAMEIESPTTTATTPKLLPLIRASSLQGPQNYPTTPERTRHKSDTMTERKHLSKDRGRWPGGRPSRASDEDSKVRLRNAENWNEQARSAGNGSQSRNKIPFCTCTVYPQNHEDIFKPLGPYLLCQVLTRLGSRSPELMFNMSSGFCLQVEIPENVTTLQNQTLRNQTVCYRQDPHPQVNPCPSSRSLHLCYVRNTTSPGVNTTSSRAAQSTNNMAPMQHVNTSTVKHEPTDLAGRLPLFFAGVSVILLFTIIMTAALFNSNDADENNLNGSLSPTQRPPLAVAYGGGSEQFKNILIEAIKVATGKDFQLCKVVLDSNSTTGFPSNTVIFYTTASERLNNSDIPTDVLATLMKTNTVIVVIVTHGRSPINPSSGAHIPHGCKIVNLMRAGPTLMKDCQRDFRTLKSGLENC